MKALWSSPSSRVADLGPLFLRVGIGTVFAWHGWQKLDGGVSNFAGFLDSLNVPAPEVVAWLQVFAEGIGGLLVILGLFTRFAVLPLIAVSVGAILLVHGEVGFIVSDAIGAELDVALLAAELCLLFMGPGRWSFDGLLGMEAGADRVTADPGRPPVAA